MWKIIKLLMKTFCLWKNKKELKPVSVRRSLKLLKLYTDELGKKRQAQVIRTITDRGDIATVSSHQIEEILWITWPINLTTEINGQSSCKTYTSCKRKKWNGQSE